MEKEVKVPASYSEFVRKRDAQFDGDPNGDYVLSQDVNELQESIERLERIISVDKLRDNVADGLDKKADKSAISDFGSPLFVNYNGSSIGAYDSLEKRVNAFSYIPHVFVKKEMSSDFPFFVEEVRKSGTNLYGSVSCTGGNLNQIEADIAWFQKLAFDGILLNDFGFEGGMNRAKQNQVLSTVHGSGLDAILTGDIETTLFNKPHPNNPQQTPLGINPSDFYLARQVFVAHGEKNEPEVIGQHALTLNKAQADIGIKILVEDTADATVDNTNLYLYGKMLATLYNLDGYCLAPLSRYALGEKVMPYIHGFELGKWKVEKPVYVEEPASVYRKIGKGTIVFNKETNTATVKDVGLSPMIYTWQDKQIPGTAVDMASATYDDAALERLVSSINSGEHLIHYSMIDGLDENGASPSLISSSVIRAINVSPAAVAKNGEGGYEEVAGNNFIHGGLIDELDASSIKSGTLSVDRVKANIVDAVNAYIGTATIDSAFIGHLSAEHIAASVVDAINLYAEKAVIGDAVIDSAAIGELKAGHIEAIVIDAVNARIGDATIDAASIGELEARNIKTSVIEAVNASIEEAVIDSAKIGTLEANHIKGMVVEAVNLYAGDAKIKSAKIEALDADHITASVVEAINLYAKNAVIGDALIDNAAISKLTAGHIEAVVIDAVNARIGTARIEAASIGELEARNIQVEVIKAVNASIEEAVIDSAKIGTLTANHIKGMVVEAINLYAGDAKIKSAQIGALKAENISAGLVEALEISASKAEFDSLKAAVISAINASLDNAFIDGAIIGEGTIDEAQIADGSITDAKIVSLLANKIQAGTIDTGKVKLQGDNGHLVITGNRMQVFDDQEVPVERVSIGDVNADGTLYGFRVRGEDGATVLYDEKGVYSEGITDGAITNPKIGEGAVDGSKHIAADTITGDKLVADSITAREIKAKSVNANHMVAGTITADSGVIAHGAIGEAEIAEASITDAHIKTLSAEKIDAGTIQLTSRNMVANSSLRDGFLEWEVDAEITASISEVVKILTTRSMQMFTTGRIENEYYGAESKPAPAMGEEAYAGSVYVQTRNPNAYDAGLPRLTIRFYRDAVLLAEEHVSVDQLTNGHWQRLSIVGTAPATTTHVTLRIAHQRNGDTFFCRPMLQKGKFVTEWTGDGSYLTDDGIYTGELHANQITAGKIRADQIQIGPDTTFDDGYSPGELREEMENRIPYNVEIISSNGLIFKRGQISTTLTASVYKGAENITDQIDEERFIWKRVSMDTDSDNAWNALNTGKKQVMISGSDVFQRATFLCEIKE